MAGRGAATGFDPGDASKALAVTSFIMDSAGTLVGAGTLPWGIVVFGDASVSGAIDAVTAAAQGD